MICGLDPGAAGGFAFLYNNCTPFSAIAMPTKRAVRGRTVVDVKTLWDLIDRVHEEVEPIKLVVVEDVHSMPSDGAAAAFGFGRTVGRLEALIELMELPLLTVTPQTWKAEILTGTDKSKAAAIGYCNNRFPTVSLLATQRSRVPHDGIAESLLIAEYGYRILTKKAG